MAAELYPKKLQNLAVSGAIRDHFEPFKLKIGAF